MDDIIAQIQIAVRSEVTAAQIEVVAELAKIKAVQSDIRSDVAKIRAVTGDPPSPQTPSLYGEELLQKAAEEPSIISDFKPTEGDAMFENVFTCSGSSGERQLVMNVYSRIQEVLGDLRLVSSEDQPWLSPDSLDSTHNQKPDLICLHKAYVLYKGTRNNVPSGVPADRRFYGNVSIIDFKVSPTPKAFGEFAIHVRYLHDEIKKNGTCKDPIENRGALAHNEGIWLVRFQNWTPRQIIKVKWNDAGSAQTLHFFFNRLDETGTVLDAVCERLGCKISVTPKAGDQAFLGAGGTGKVFRVQHGMQTRAVKIVVGHEKVKLLRYEVACLKHVEILKVAVRVLDYLEVEKDDVVIGAGFLMEPVATPISKVRKPAEYFYHALRALCKIHAAGSFHGDPRMQNILWHQKSAIFCDFRQHAGIVGDGAGEVKVEQDMDIIFESFGIQPTKELIVHVKAYAKLRTEEMMETIIRELSQKATSSSETD